MGTILVTKIVTKIGVLTDKLRNFVPSATGVHSAITVINAIIFEFYCI